MSKKLRSRLEPLDSYFLNKFNFGNSLESFYKGTSNTLLNKDNRDCLNTIYGNKDASYTNTSYEPDIINFGKKKQSDKLYLLSLFKRH